MENRNYSVYIHLTPDNCIYIGQTEFEPKERWKNGKGYCVESPIGKKIKEFGWDKIKHLIFKDNITASEAATIERDLIEFYSMNEYITGRKVLNVVYNQSELSKKKMEREKKCNKGQQRFPKPVLQYDLNGNLLNEYGSISEAARKNDLIGSRIGRACINELEGSNVYNGFIWEFKNWYDVYLD